MTYGRCSKAAATRLWRQVMRALPDERRPTAFRPMTRLTKLKRLLDADVLLDAVDRFEAWNARQSPFLRFPLGIGLCLGGLLAILPVFGLWMLPLGLMVLSEDIPWLKDKREHFEAWLRKAIAARRARHGERDHETTRD